MRWPRTMPNPVSILLEAMGQLIFAELAMIIVGAALVMVCAL